MNQSIITRFAFLALTGSLLASCQSPQTTAQPVHRPDLLYSSAAIKPHVDPPGEAAIARKPEGLASRGLHRVAQGLSVVGRAAALPATLVFGGMAGNEEALSSAGRFFTEPLP